MYFVWQCHCDCTHRTCGLCPYSPTLYDDHRIVLYNNLITLISHKILHHYFGRYLVMVVIWLLNTNNEVSALYIDLIKFNYANMFFFIINHLIKYAWMVLIGSEV